MFASVLSRVGGAARATAATRMAAVTCRRSMGTSIGSKIEDFGRLRFDEAAMREHGLDDATINEINTAVKTGVPVPEAAGAKYATALYHWAQFNGLENFSHQFYPLRGMKSGNKKDAFIDLDFGDPKPIRDVVHDFGAAKFYMAETDGSSFPNGGLRATHTAAAYMAADRTSPPYAFGDTLMIPSVLVTWNGEAMDHKMGLLRSQEAVSTEGTRLLHHLGFTDVKEVYSNVGCEQELFMIPRELVVERPDLLNAGRTVLGAAPARGQQLSDHYFTKINPRVRAFFVELQTALWDVGISKVVYHNEVAPAQHELSPIFTLVNVAADQNVLTAELCQELALKHGFVCLLHEKPFQGINGSGKHCNWGLNADWKNMNLYTPGKTAETQRSFMAFTTALLHAFHAYPEALRASVATSGNDFRLGADEAPPAIFSVALGHHLAQHVDNILVGGPLDGYTGGRYGDKMIETHSRAVGPIGGALEDRNRTAPIPFCGNRFEFRAVGSNQNIALPMTVLNTAVADGCAALSDLIESGKSVEEAVQTVIRESSDILFNGNGYSAEWHHEAEFERKLPNLKDTPAAWEVFNSDKNKALFAKHKVFTSNEVEALQEINLQRYSDDVQIESQTMIDMLNQGVLPAAAEDLKTYKGTNLARDREDVYEALSDSLAELSAAHNKWPTDDALEGAKYASEVIKPLMAKTREAHDAAELLINKDIYPFPTYHEMLFQHQEDI